MKNIILTFICFCLALQALPQNNIIQLKLAANNGDIFFHLDKAPWLFTNTTSVQPPLLNTTQWQTLPGSDFNALNAPPGWKGIGWFALSIKADSTFAGKKLAMQINHDGASEIFVDGKPAGGYGTLGHSAETIKAMRAPKALIPLWLNDTLPHVITVHYANFTPAYQNFWGFQMAFADYSTAYNRIAASNNRMNFILMTVGAHFILGFLSLFLYLFYRTQKLNFYYALFVLLLGITMLSIYVFYQTSVPGTQFYAEIATYVCKVLMMWAGSIMLYAVGYRTIPGPRVILVSFISLTYIILNLVFVFFYNKFEWNDYFSWVFLLFTIDGFMAVYRAIKRKLPGVWLVAAGMAAISAVYFFAWGDVFGLWPWHLNSLRLLVMAVGNLIFPACFSLYLALDYARTNHRLTQKLAEVRLLYDKNIKQEAEKLELVVNQAAKLEATVKERTAEIQQQADKLKEMDAIKSRFFTNLTHEFKTPLTLILSPAQELMKVTGTDMVKKHAGLIQSNAEKLLQLINQLLDLSKLENGVMQVNPEPVDLVMEIDSQLQLYTPLAVQKEIKVFFNSHDTALYVWIDKDKFNKILHNILSNAFKFTQKGTIEITLDTLTKEGVKSIELRIKDSGSGIPPGKLPYIFERFYQADIYDTRNYEGTGIGLALAKELALLMGGTITAESIEHKYTTITLALPCITAETTGYNTAQPFTQPLKDIEEPLAEETAFAEGGKNVVLIIEDNKHLRDFLTSILSETYTVISTGDGISGIALAQEKIPDIVITDIMMPGADGYQVSNTLKTDVRTSHIPLVFLTAKSGPENRLRGIETGADAYLEKPFNPRELHAVIENLVRLRSLLHKKYSNSALPFTIEKQVPSIEEHFINRIKAFIKENLHNPQFGADQLALHMSLSRSQLHRKLKGLLDKSPGELIRNIRMEHAHYLLKNNVTTIAEAAYIVGFASPSAFTTAFSRYFGYPPGEINQKAATA